MINYNDQTLNDLFCHHPPKEGQIEKYQAIREAGKAFAKVIRDNTPTCQDQAIAIGKVRVAVMVANAAIALEGRY